MSDIKITIGGDIKDLQSKLAQAGGVTQDFANKATAANTKVGSSFKQMASQAVSAGVGISSLGATLLSGGLALGVSAAIAGLIALGKSIFDVTKEQQRFSDVLEGAKSAYVKATLEVDNMRDTFDKARSGVISKEKALQIYNSTIGRTIGQTNDLEIAEKNFIANAENYIKFTLLKSAANIALGKAAEAAFKAEQERLEGPKKATFLERFSMSRYGGLSQEELMQNRINKALKEKSSFQAIYNSLLAQANAMGFKGIDQVEEETNARVKLNKVKFEPIDTEHYDHIFVEKIAPVPLKFSPKVIVTPKITVPDDPALAQQVIDGIANMLKQAEFEKAFEEFETGVNARLKSIAVTAIAGFGEAIGLMLAGEGGLPDLFGGLIRDLGAQVKELGVYLIQTGLKMEAAKKALALLIKNPILQVVAGIALVALGTLLQASVRKKNPGFASGTRNFGGGFATVGERGPERVFLPQGSSVQPNNEVNAYGGGGLVLQPSIHYEGTGFRIMLNRVDEQMGRNN